ncbi:rho GTPase-activating protein 29-like isoform X3 [Acipenser ruthenus]|uniref:rho GTPase-activating protein 29-like isoform X3 n=1 Tax=Acipenser ruthenus TaxID=7906 RepID=UPI002741CA3B|nr:rho GTPase-activating protein 29-like isoform X3 [Acipenser ruthenus]
MIINQEQPFLDGSLAASEVNTARGFSSTAAAAGMLRQNNNSGGNKLTLGIARLTNSHFFPLAATTGSSGMGCSTKSNSLSSISSSSDCQDSPGVDPDYIMQLVSDVRKFADVLLHLKEAFHAEENQDCLHQVVHERLGDLLRVLKAVISKHQALNSVDILREAGTVIAKVKGVNFKDVNEDNKQEIFSSIDTLAFTFGNVVSDFLMGDVDSGSALGLPQTRRSRSFENLSVESGGLLAEKDDLQSHLRAKEVDNMLLKNDSGIESALLYAKAWSKYTKDVLSWVEKRLSLDMECAKNFVKMAESAKALVGQQEHMPFREIYTSAFQNDIEYSHLLLQTATALQTNKFIQPLLARRNELDKLRKEIKEQWQREQKKMQEADSALRKARLLYDQRHEEYGKAKFSTIRAEEEQLGLSGGLTKDGSKVLEKRRRLEEEALQKADEASEQYKNCEADCSEKKINLENVKSEILTQLRELVFQCDLTLKAVTVNLFQMQQGQVVSLPVNYQSLCESAKLYEPGQRYSEFVKSLPKEESPLESFSFETQMSQTEGLQFGKRTMNSAHSSHGNLSQMSVTSGDFQSVDDVDSPVHMRTGKMGETRSNSSTDIQALRGQGPFRAWPTGSQGGGMCSDSESAGGSSESRSMDSPTASPGAFKRRLPRTPSTGTMSSADDLDEREPPSPSDNGINEITCEMASSPGPFRNALLSKAAQTHRLRKLRAPSKCRECDSLVVFQGAECEECSLACHKKCLETLAIQCGHKKLHGRLHLFGVDFTLAAKNNPDGIPFIIKKCTSEIENRALNIKGIYRVNGAKSRVEKLCQAFENGKDLVELSDLYPHDISNVLKLYLRQLPEPLILFRHYNEFIGLAKESQQVNTEEVDGRMNSPGTEKPHLSIELNRIIFKIRDMLRQLPRSHYSTLQYLIRHLCRVAEKQEENKMTASNLGIIFGPTLIKPRQTDAEVSLSSLVDYPYQARIVELLILHYGKIFDLSLSPLSAIPLAGESSTFELKGTNFSAEDKEQHLKRHSKSLVDIKEQSSKVYKRHSSIIPSTHLMDEVKDVKHKPAMFEISEKFPSEPSLQEGQKSAFCKSNHSVAKVQMRPPRSKLAFRPISMPGERLLNPSRLNEKNSRNVNERDRSPAIEKTLDTTKTYSTCCRSSYYDTQSLRRTWDKQYKHYNITPRTAMIMANVPLESQQNDTLSASSLASYNLGSTSGNTMRSNKPYTAAFRPVQTAKKEASSFDGHPASSCFRAPRTLQPPPGTFYKPPSINREKQAADLVPKTYAAATSNSETGQGDTVKNPNDCDATSSVSSAQLPSPNSSPEDLSQSDVRPVYQRLRPRRLQELENREAHFV